MCIGAERGKREVVVIRDLLSGNEIRGSRCTVQQTKYLLSSTYLVILVRWLQYAYLVKTFDISPP